MKSIFNPMRVWLILAAAVVLSVMAACSSGSTSASAPAISVPADWPLLLDGTQSYSMNEAQFQEGALHHPASYSDASGSWTGMALWRLAGWVDGDIQHGSGAFNDALADTGYTIKVSSADGSYQIFNSATIKRNDDIILANRLNGAPLPATDPLNPGQRWYPLRIVGPGLQNGQQSGAIVKIELLGLPTTPPVEEEATEFQGTPLTPISQQGNAALAGVQFIDRDTYRLTVDGLVDHPLSLSYADLQAYAQESWLMDLNCVDGWYFTAKWTGPKLSAIFSDAQVRPDAKIAIFYTADVPTGYTSLDLDYIRDNDIIIALKDNDITLTPERGFPFQVVAKSKFGYKWAKWVTRIELSSDTDFRGYWESGGIDNGGDIGAP
jgi:DMSO/TMAO reductase YedYZ molybdopterin-dependent catalytic subunit